MRNALFTVLVFTLCGSLARSQEKAAPSQAKSLWLVTVEGLTPETFADPRYPALTAIAKSVDPQPFIPAVDEPMLATIGLLHGADAFALRDIRSATSQPGLAQVLRERGARTYSSHPRLALRLPPSTAGKYDPKLGIRDRWEFGHSPEKRAGILRDAAKSDTGGFGWVHMDDWSRRSDPALKFAYFKQATTIVRRLWDLHRQHPQRDSILFVLVGLPGPTPTDSPPRGVIAMSGGQSDGPLPLHGVALKSDILRRLGVEVSTEPQPPVLARSFSYGDPLLSLFAENDQGQVTIDLKGHQTTGQGDFVALLAAIDQRAVESVSKEGASSRDVASARWALRRGAKDAAEKVATAFAGEIDKDEAQELLLNGLTSGVELDTKTRALVAAKYGRAAEVFVRANESSFVAEAEDFKEISPSTRAALARLWANPRFPEANLLLLGDGGADAQARAEIAFAWVARGRTDKILPLRRAVLNPELKDEGSRLLEALASVDEKGLPLVLDILLGSNKHGLAIKKQAIALAVKGNDQSLMNLVARMASDPKEPLSSFAIEAIAQNSSNVAFGVVAEVLRSCSSEAALAFTSTLIAEPALFGSPWLPGAIAPPETSLKRPFEFRIDVSKASSDVLVVLDATSPQEERPGTEDLPRLVWDGDWLRPYAAIYSGSQVLLRFKRPRAQSERGIQKGRLVLGRAFRDQSNAHWRAVFALPRPDKTPRELVSLGAGRDELTLNAESGDNAITLWWRYDSDAPEVLEHRVVGRWSRGGLRVDLIDREGEFKETVIRGFGRQLHLRLNHLAESRDLRVVAALMARR